ncbi:MAG TPA: C2 family cysteine protease [Phycisphaerae bacterium]|nr:C2 family cysteine protease [Phycisphaerae bacterium]
MSDLRKKRNQSTLRGRRLYGALMENLEPRTLMSITTLAAPAALGATAKSPTSIQLNWLNRDKNSLGYYVLRSSDGVNFAQISKILSVKTTSFIDTTVTSGTTYRYEVEAENGNVTSLVSNMAAATTPLMAPTHLVAAALSGNQVHLTWTGADATAAGYYVLRAIDGTHFARIGMLTVGGPGDYVDSSVVSGRFYTYEVQAYNGAILSAVSNNAAVGTPLTAPSGLTTTLMKPTSIRLNWVNNDPDATGYYVMRSPDGVNFKWVATVNGAATATYTDNSVATLHSYTYEIEAFAGTIISTASNAAQANTALLVPASLTATAKSPTSIQLNWVDADASATGFDVLRSTDGVHFSQIAQILSNKIASYTDLTVSSDNSYTYEVMSYAGTVTSGLSNVAAATTPLFAPTGLNAAAQSGTSIQLAWTDNDSTAAGYSVLRSSDGVHFGQIANLTAGNAAAYTDNTVISGHTYVYEVQAYSGAVTSAASNSASVGTPLAAPSALGTLVKGPTSVQLNWTDNDVNAGGYYVLRSGDGVNFTPIVKLTGASVASYTDNTAASLHNYTYEVEAFAGTIISAVSNPASANTPLVVPTALAASAKSPTSIQLSWTDTDASALGYYVLRSSDGINFSQIAQIASNKTVSYTDNAVSSDHAYSYQVEAYNGGTTSAVSNTAAATTPLFAVTGLTATAQSGTTIQLAWTDNDSAAAGYYVLRASDGIHFSQVANLTLGSASSYTDAAALSGHSYTYEVQAYNGTITAVVSSSTAVSTPLTAPSNLTATVKGPTSVQLNWTDNDVNAGGYYVLRSSDGVTFTQLAKLTTATAATYTDATAASGHNYTYEVEALAGTIVSAVSNTATAGTPLAAPTGLAATVTGAYVTLAWTNKDAGSTGYVILRSTDGLTFSQLATITSASTTSYVDTTVSASQTYYYQVQAVNATANSAASNTASVTTPMAGGGNVTVTTRYGNELVITVGGLHDSITLDQNGGTLTITADGQTLSDPIPAGGLFLYTRGGSDSIVIDQSVAVRTTVDAIDGALTFISSAGSNVSAWFDSTDTFSGTGVAHSVASFAGNVSKALGASLPDPTDSGATAHANLSLWGTGPVMGDVNQGSVGDCYFLSSLAAFADTNAAKLQESTVDMGDGTYTVQFISNGQPKFVRVSNDFPTGYFNGWKFAHPGSDNTIWAMVLEKAFAYVRTGANTYNSINGGWMGDVYSDFGISSTTLWPSSSTDSALYTQLSTALAGGKAVTFGTYGSPPNLVGGHAYTLVRVFQDSNGVRHYVVRNPWGVAGDSLEDSQGYATLTFAQLTANFADGCMAV